MKKSKTFDDLTVFRPAVLVAEETREVLEGRFKGFSLRTKESSDPDGSSSCGSFASPAGSFADAPAAFAGGGVGHSDCSGTSTITNTKHNAAATIDDDGDGDGDEESSMFYIS